MPTTRAKLTCSSVEERKGAWPADGGPYDPEKVVHVAKLYAVADGSEENKQFFASTPQATLEIGVMRDCPFEVGKSYYLDFTEAD